MMTILLSLCVIALSCGLLTIGLSGRASMGCNGGCAGCKDCPKRSQEVAIDVK